MPTFRSVSLRRSRASQTAAAKHAKAARTISQLNALITFTPV